MRTEPVFEIKDSNVVVLSGTNFIAETKTEVDLVAAMFSIPAWPEPLGKN